MAKTAETVQSSTAEPLSLVDELILILLEEKGGYFHQAPGWQLNGAVVVVGVLAELSFRSRLDSDLASLFVVDPPEAGDPVLDPILREIVGAPGQPTARYGIERVLQGHTSAQRADNPRNLRDDSLSLHASDPRFLPESDLLFAFSAALIASVYLGDAFSLMVYAMASRLDLYAKIQAETDALFANGDPEKEDFTPANIDVTHRFLPSRKKRDSLGPAPYELGTHRCLGTGWMEMHLAVNLLMLAHHFTVEVSPAKYARELRFNPFPSMMPSMKLKFRISEQRRELPA